MYVDSKIIKKLPKKVLLDYINRYEKLLEEVDYLIYVNNLYLAEFNIKKIKNSMTLDNINKEEHPVYSDLCKLEMLIKTKIILNKEWKQ